MRDMLLILIFSVVAILQLRYPKLFFQLTFFRDPSQATPAHYALLRGIALFNLVLVLILLSCVILVFI